MKPLRSTIALFIALIIHLLVIGFFLLPRIHITPPERHSVPLTNVIMIPSSAPLHDNALPEDPSPSKEFQTDFKTLIPKKPKQSYVTIPQKSDITDHDKITPDQIETLPRSVLYHYGEEFFDLDSRQQHYILDNLQKIRLINNQIGTKILRTKPEAPIDPSDSNVVSFTLHPDGSISDLELQDERVGFFLDELTLQTVKEAYRLYPKPKSDTLIKIRVFIVIK